MFVDVAKTCQRLVKQLERHSGIVEQHIFDLTLVVISRTDLVDAVNDEKAWEKHVGPALQNLRPLTGDGLFTASNDEPNWRKAHNIVMPAFTKAAMQGYHPSMVAAVRELVDVWTTRAADGAWVDIPADANRRTRTDVIPLYEKLLGQRRRQKHLRDKAYLREQTTTIINARRANGRDEDFNDILDIMLHAKDPQTGEKLDDANIINQITTLLVAGSETSANTIAFALHYLSRNPHIADTARDEIDQRWPGRDFPDITFDDVAKLRYLRRIVDETLRLWPVAPGYFRQAKADTAIGDGSYAFKAGDWVFVLLLAAHRDHTAWGPDAAEFNPDRFLPDNIRTLPPHIYKPFGTGVRSCLGRQFALHEIVLTLAVILHQFDIEPRTGYQLTVSETLTLKPAGLRLRLHRREMG